jgi:hypothetical protein
MTLARDAVRCDLPRLLYLGDVPPESTVESPSLLFRLLQDYPKERLRVLFRSEYKSDASQRLPGIRYGTFHLDLLKLPPTRFSLNRTATLFTADFLNRGAYRFVSEFQPQAILTIAHGFGCLSAAALARSLGVPLHFVLHDDWMSWVGVPRHFLPAASTKFSQVYNQSASRFCITPYMEEAYARLYGAKGQVLYPQRPSDLPEFEAPAHRGGTLTVAFAGTVWPVYACSLRHVASYLSQVGGRLLLFSRQSEEELAGLQLTGAGVELRPFCRADALVRTLREEADILLVPMDFATQTNSNMLYAFPSKLTVYTATGVPMIIWGPPQCSAVRWAHDCVDVAEVVDKDDPCLLETTIRRLAGDPRRRYHLALRALAAGREFFSYSRGRDFFFNRLCDAEPHAVAAPVPLDSCKLQSEA